MWEQVVRVLCRQRGESAVVLVEALTVAAQTLQQL